MAVVRLPAFAELFADAGSLDREAVPIHLVGEGQEPRVFERLPAHGAAFARSTFFTGVAKKHLIVPDAAGSMAGVLLGVGRGPSRQPCGPAAIAIGHLPTVLPAGIYRLANADEHAGTEALAAVAWGLGSYRYLEQKSEPGAAPRPQLVLPSGLEADRVRAIVEGVWLGRDLINRPASDLGPAEIEAAVRDIGSRHGATVTSIVGDDLLTEGCRLIHAVGRASPRAPRLIDLTWGRPGAPRLTLVGKGIAFDTGGLDIKPAAGMLLMKKDMGGAAAALAAAHMIMSDRIEVRLRLLIPAAENSIGGDAMRPGDVIRSRAGRTVEIGNTDAEGRLVLADALSIAEEDQPDTLITLATLTGAARTALGPDLPAMFTDDERLAARFAETGQALADPVWRMPFWPGYDRGLDSEVADMGNVADGAFAGAITAALFLKRFVTRSRHFVHFDLYGWSPQPRPLGPKGGEPHVARLIHALAHQGAFNLP